MVHITQKIFQPHIGGASNNYNYLLAFVDSIAQNSYGFKDFPFRRELLEAMSHEL